MKRLLDVLQAATEYLSGKGVENPRLVTEQLMGHVLGCPRLQLYLRFETLLDDRQLESLRAGVRRLAAGEPLQYVVGETDFMGHRFKVDKRALIPRPETEILVESVLRMDSVWASACPVVADVGTGSGCIAVSLALALPKARIVALDASAEALELARDNARAHGVAERIDFRQADLVTGLAGGSLDAIVANLPYIPASECERLPRHIRDHEPRPALDGGEDGLRLIARLVDSGFAVLKPGGALCMETGCDQARRTAELMVARGYARSTVQSDLAGRDRVVSAFTPARG